MKTAKFLSIFLIGLMPLMSFQSKPSNEGYYAFFIISGVWNDNTGYASRVFYFPGYNECNKNESTHFFRSAKRAFSDHLKAYYSETFPYGSTNIEEVIFKKYSTSDLLKTRAQAEQRLTEWVAEQKEKGYKVRHTNFSFSCDNL